MTPRVTVRRRLAWAAFVVLFCSVLASLRMHRRDIGVKAAAHAACALTERDSGRIARLAADTLGDLRARGQRVTRFSRTPGGVEVRTEDDDSLSAHDGGLAAFDCSGRLTFLWLDGG
jgi:hypothetical protein